MAAGIVSVHFDQHLPAVLQFILQDLQELSITIVHGRFTVAECPVGRNIHKVMDGRLSDVQTAMENELKSITLAEIVAKANHVVAVDVVAGRVN